MINKIFYSYLEHRVSIIENLRSAFNILYSVFLNKGVTCG